MIEGYDRMSHAFMYTAIVASILCILIPSMWTLSSIEGGANEEDHWLVPENERIYNNSVDTLLYPRTSNITEIARDIGEVFGFTPVNSSFSDRSLLENGTPVRIFLFEGGQEFSIHLHSYVTPENNVTEEGVFQHFSMTFSVRFNEEDEYGRIAPTSEQERIDTTTQFMELMGFPFDENYHVYNENEHFNFGYLKIFQMYRGRRINAAYVQTAYNLTTGNLTHFTFTKHVAISVEPYLSEKGCLSIASQWYNDSKGDRSITGFEVWNEKLYYRVTTVYKNGEYVTGDHILYIDVQNADVIDRGGGGTCCPSPKEEDEFPRLEIIIALGALACVLLFVVIRHRQ